MIGSLVARLRSLWYDVAARWAVRHLMGQQAVINQQQRIIDQQQSLLNQVYIRSLVSLSQEVASLAQSQHPEQGHGTVQDVAQARL